MNKRFTSKMKSVRAVLIMLTLIGAAIIAPKISSAQSGALQKVYATTIVNDDNVANRGNAIDQSTSTFATLTAERLAILSSNGRLTLGFANTLPANTTTYIQLNTDNGLLDALLGGSLGNVLRGVLGIVTGAHQFKVEARQNGSLVYGHDSSNQFNTDRARIIIDANGNQFLAITPTGSYNQILIENRVPSLIGSENLHVGGAFYYSGTESCGTALGTGYDVAGVNLSLLNNPNAIAQNLGRAIDGDINTASVLTPGTVNVGLLSSISQYFYFSGDSKATDEFKITLSVDKQLADVNLLNDIQVFLYDGANQVHQTSIGTITDNVLGLLDLDLLGLLNSGNKVTFSIRPGAAFDRVEIRAGSVLTLNTVSQLSIWEVSRTAGTPTVQGVNTDGIIEVCTGTPVTLTALPATSTDIIKWYDAPQGGNLVYTGANFNVGALAYKTAYYVSATTQGCTEESERTRVIVDINKNPQLSVHGSTVYSSAIGQRVTLPSITASNDSGTPVNVIGWQAQNGAPMSGGSAGPFAAAGTYVYRYLVQGDDCTNFVDVVVYVGSTDGCDLVMNRVFANNGNDYTVSTLLNLVDLGTVQNPGRAANGNLTSYSTLTETANVLSVLGETSQTLRWNQNVAPGKPVTVRLGREFTTVGAVGSITVQAYRDNQPLGDEVRVDANLVAVLGGYNDFEYTFIPTNNGVPAEYNAVKIRLGSSVANVIQTVRVYGAYYHERSATLSDCNAAPEIRTGFETVLTGIDVASTLTAVGSPGNAVDKNPSTYATINRLVGVQGSAYLDLGYRSPVLVGDSVKMLLGSSTGLLDLALLGNFSIQRYYGNQIVGSPIALNSSLLTLRLLGGNTQGYLQFENDLVFDRIKISAGGVASVLEELRVYEVTMVPVVKLPGEQIDSNGLSFLEICAGTAITLPTDGCTQPKFFDAASGGNELSIADIQAWPSGTTRKVYVQAVRFGCNLGSERRELEIRVTEVAVPVLQPAGTQTVRAGDNITLSVSNIADYTGGVTFEWYKNGTRITGQSGSTLVFNAIDIATDLGNYTVIAIQGCASPASLPVSFVAGSVDYGRSTLEVTKDNAVANGVDQNRLLATIIDASGQPIPNQEVVFEVMHVDGNLSAEAIMTNAAGQAPLAIVSTMVGTVEVEAFVVGRSISGSPKTVRFVAGPVDHAKSTLEIVKNNAVADGVDENRLMATIVDTYNNPIANASVVFQILDVDNNSSTETLQTNAQGQALLSVRSTKAGSVSVAASVGGTAISGSPRVVTFVAADGLAVYKTPDQTTVIAGTATSYTVTIRNNGLAPVAQNGEILLKERPGVNLTITGFQIISGQATISNTGNDAVIRLTSDLAPGTAIVVKVNATVSASAKGTITNGVSIWGPDTPPTDDPDDEDDTPPTPVDQITDLAIEKTVNNTRPYIGSNIVFTITATNIGPSDATNARVIDQLPSGFEYVGSSASKGQYTPANHRWSIGNMAAGEVQTLTITAKVLGTGDYVNYATITGDDEDPDLDNNEDTPDDIIEPQPANGLRVEKTADINSVKAGDPITFTIVITNDGPDVLEIGDEIILRELPSVGLTINKIEVTAGNASLTFASNQAVLITTEEFEVGQNITLKVTGTVAQDAPNSISNGVKIWGPDKDPDDDDPDSETETPDIPVDNSVTLSINKQAAQSSVASGGTLLFEVTVTNDGPGILKSGQQIIIEEIPGPGIEIKGVSVSSNNGSVVSSGTPGNILTVSTSADISKRGTIVVQVEALVVAEAGSTIKNGVKVWGPDKDPDDDDPDDEDDTPEIPVTENYTLSISKSADESSVSPGTETTFTITVTNQGPEAIPSGDKMTLRELPGQGLTILGYEIVSGAGQIQGNANQAIITTTGAVAAGNAIVVKIRAKVDEQASGTITNGIAIWSKDKNPDTDIPDDEDSSGPVPVDTQISIPNLFTPNGDGVNDKFVIRGLQQFDQRELIIINRWGNQVYNNKNYNNDWDGGSLSEGTYYYILTVRKQGSTATHRGSIAIVRQTNR